MDQKIIRDKLSNDFPTVYIKDIDLALKINKNSYISSYYYLEEKIKQNNLKVKKVSSKPKYLELTNDLESLFNSIKPSIECNCCCEEKLIAHISLSICKCIN